MFFKKIELPYQLNEFEPIISKKTMNIHFQFLNKYENELESILKNCKKLNLEEFTLEEFMEKYHNIPEINQSKHQDINNYGGGLLNYNLFLRILGKEKKLEENEKIKDVLIDKFSSIENFQKELIEKCLEPVDFRFLNSYWVWLVIDERKNLKFIKTSYQNYPQFFNLKPIIGICLWNHAYLIDYELDKKKYVSNLLSILNWKEIEDIYLSYIIK
jgi:superoxide dismutase, Fe-Mn family